MERVLAFLEKPYKASDKDLAAQVSWRMDRDSHISAVVTDFNLFDQNVLISKDV